MFTTKRNLLIFFFILFYSGCQSPNKGATFNQYIKTSTDQNNSLEVQLEAAKKALLVSNEQDSDSLKLIALAELQRISLDKADFKALSKYARSSIKLSYKEKKIFPRAKSYSYLGYSHLMNYAKDSAYYYYYRAGKLYRRLNDSLSIGKTLLSMSIIEKDNNDFISAMTTTIMAEKLIKPLNDYRLMGSIYNELGINSNELGYFSQAIDYHHKALEYRKMINNPTLIVETFNNIGVVYKNKNQIDLAVKYFKKALLANDSIVTPKLKAMFMDNLGHAYLLGSKKELSRPLLEEAVRIRKSINDLSGLVVSYIHLAELHKEVNPKATKLYLGQAIQISKKLNADKDLLACYKMLSLLDVTDTKYVKQYIDLNDSIKIAQSNNINKFARIKYESDVLLEQNEKARAELSYKQNQISNRNYFILLLIIIVTLIGVLIFLLYKIFRYNKKLYMDFNHRTRNNLSHIQRGIFKLKNLKGQTVNENIVKAINELEMTTNAQFLVFNMLEGSDNPQFIRLKDYLMELVRGILKSNSDFEVSLKASLATIEVNPKTASVVGLIVNEFLTNSFKHAFSVNRPNQIQINTELLQDNRVVIDIHSSGRYWQVGKVNTGSGILIMKSLAKEINAIFELFYKDETVLRLTFAIKDESFLWKKLSF